ncbi:MAG: hypothetical protein P8183_19035 [Anaerolineae bacterium]
MNKRNLGIFILLSVVWLLWATSITAQNEDEHPVNVGLRYFTASVQADGVHLEWATETELNTAGFVIDRSPGTSTNFVRLDNIGFVTSLGGVATGATYSEVDNTAVLGQTYTYKLVEIETNSSENDLEMVTVTFIITPTPTSIVIGGGNPTSASTQPAQSTLTRQPTSTPTRTPTVVSSNATATAVPIHTATPQPIIVTSTNRPDTPTPFPSASPTPIPVIDRVSTTSNDGIVLAQEEPTAYPAPDSTQNEPVNTSYPPGQAPEAVPTDLDPSPYPEGFQPAVRATAAIIGSDVTKVAAENSDSNLPAPSADILRGRILLWAGFLISLLIFLSGVVGAIMLYRRRPS